MTPEQTTAVGAAVILMHVPVGQSDAYACTYGWRSTQTDLHPASVLAVHVMMQLEDAGVVKP